MANIQHSTLTDPYLHEPKGIASAAANTVYLANGSASGTWTNANRFPGTGWGQYRNAFFVGTTADNFTTTEKLLTFTEDVTVTQIPISLGGTTSSLMDLTNDKLLFITTGDLHAVTLTFKIYATSGGTVNHIDTHLYGSSDGTTYATNLGETTTYVTKGAGQVITITSLFPVTADMVTHGAKIYMNTNAHTASIIDIGLITARVHKARS